MFRRSIITHFIVSGLCLLPTGAFSSTVELEQKLSRSALDWVMEYANRKDFFSSCDVVKSSENYTAFKDSILKNFVTPSLHSDINGESGTLTRAEQLTEKLSENACRSTDESVVLDSEPAKFLHLLMSNPDPGSMLSVRELLLLDKRQIFSTILKIVAKSEPRLMDTSFEILNGYGVKNVAWCAAFIHAMVRGMDCLFETEVLDRYRAFLESETSSLGLTNEDIQSYRSWIWGMPEDSIGFASNFIQYAPDDLIYNDSSECMEGSISVWSAVRSSKKPKGDKRNTAGMHGHASMIVDELLSTVAGNGGNAGRGQHYKRVVRLLDGSSSNVSEEKPISGYPWQACIPIWN